MSPIRVVFDGSSDQPSLNGMDSEWRMDCRGHANIMVALRWHPTAAATAAAAGPRLSPGGRRARLRPQLVAVVPTAMARRCTLGRPSSPDSAPLLKYLSFAAFGKLSNARRNPGGPSTHCRC